jgi:carbamoyltransferase
LYSIIEKFREITGVPVILNTSFNDNNEPIVETPEDAIRCFMGTNIDALLIDGDTLLIKP